MLTVEEAIAYYEREKRRNKSIANDIESSALCKKHRMALAEYAGQLAEWLRELKERRKEPKIIRCGECEHSRDWGCELYCTKWVRYTSHNGYCHRGAERRTDD